MLQTRAISPGFTTRSIIPLTFDPVQISSGAQHEEFRIASAR
jgi:hypothetical protein